MKRKPYKLALALFLLAGVLSCSKIMPERNIDYSGGRVLVNLPRGLRNAETDRNLDKPTAVVVSLPNNDEIYVGTERTASAKEDLRFKLRQLLQDHAEPDRIVYLGAAFTNDYGSVVWMCDAIRKQGVSRVGLLAINVDKNLPGRILVELPAEPDPNEDLRMLKPNPLTLVVSISTDLRLKLNQDDIGNVNDSAPLSVKLQQILRLRKEMRAYKPGLETRTDLTEDERVEKTITVKAPRSIKYGDVMKIVDAIKGAGASPIVLQLDDLVVVRVLRESTSF
jgi:biopolymer transport protein ExbD